MRPFRVEEYQARLARVRAEMARLGIDVLVATEPENLYYLAGHFTAAYWAPQALLLPIDGAPVVVAAESSRGDLELTAWVREYETYDDGEDPHARIAAALASRGYGRARLGVEKRSWYLTVAGFARLAGALPQADWVDASRLIDRLRLVKSPREVEYLRAASKAAEAAVRAGIEAAADGRTEADLAEAVFAAVVAHGSDRVDLGVIASGERMLLAHGRFTRRRIRSGDLIRFELTGRASNYDGRFMRCLSVGQPSDDARRAAESTGAALGDAIALMRPGVAAGEVDRAARERLERETGYRWPTKTGYSMGIMCMPNPGEHNLLTFMPGDTWRLEAGMAFHMLILGPGLVGHSEMVVVTETGHEVLTDMPRTLFVR